MLDKYTRQCLAIQVERQIRSGQVLAALWQAMMPYGIPDISEAIMAQRLSPVKSNDGSVRIRSKRSTLSRVAPDKTATLRASISRFRDECLNREWLLNLREARVVIEDWRQHYNKERPHSRLGYLSPEDYIKQQ